MGGGEEEGREEIEKSWQKDVGREGGINPISSPPSFANFDTFCLHFYGKVR